MIHDDSVPQVLPEWETGPVRDLTDPHVYLPEDPTPSEQRLADALDREAANVHLAKIAIRGWGHAVWIRSVDGFAKRLRRWLMIGAGLAAGNLSAVGYHWFRAHDEAVAAQVRAAADETLQRVYRDANDRALERLQKEIDILRRELRRIGGANPDPGVGVVAVGAP